MQAKTLWGLPMTGFYLHEIATNSSVLSIGPKQFQIKTLALKMICLLVVLAFLGKVQSLLVVSRLNKPAL